MSSELEGKINISPKVDFEDGLNFQYDLIVGEKGKEEIKNLPDYFSKNPVSLSLELLIDNADNGSEVV